MDEDFLEKLDTLRELCGFPFKITSGYRSINHSIEAKKSKPETHAEGIAADIHVSNGYERFKIISNALELGFTGIGVDKHFIHVDTRKSTPVIWSY
jgi:zinc D-Ala-D-Ala carboxypeptidase